MQVPTVSRQYPHQINAELIYISLFKCKLIFVVQSETCTISLHWSFLCTNTQLHTSCRMWFILLGHPLLDFLFLFVFFLLSIHCLAHCWCFFLFTTDLVQNNDSSHRSNASTCMAAPAVKMTEQLNWNSPVWTFSINTSVFFLYFIAFFLLKNYL